ncbi:replication protein A, subunit RPA32 [Serendipita vermifera]|nr:replication protein A, subunit RPA32 [Serendipita vermifera]
MNSSQGPFYGGGGGGFMSSASQATPGGAGGGKTNNHSLRPVNIAQVHMAEQASHTDGEYTIEGHPVTMITLVAQVRALKAQTTSDVYFMHDGSGEVEARHWIEGRTEDDMDTDRDDSAVLSHYVRIIGTIRTYQGKRHINASLVRVLDDPMEAFFHFNEVMAVTMFYKHGPPSGAGGAPATSSAYYQAGRTTTGVDPSLAHLGRLEQGIARYFKENPSPPDGYHVKVIIKAVKELVAEQCRATGDAEGQVFATAIDVLTTEGVLYSTLDEQHYALCT